MSRYDSSLLFLGFDLLAAFDSSDNWLNGIISVHTVLRQLTRFGYFRILNALLWDHTWLVNGSCNIFNYVSNFIHLISKILVWPNTLKMSNFKPIFMVIQKVKGFKSQIYRTHWFKMGNFQRKLFLMIECQCSWFLHAIRLLSPQLS